MTERRQDKYGLPIEEAHRMVERHFQVKAEEDAISTYYVHHALQDLPKVFDALRQKQHSSTP